MSPLLVEEGRLGTWLLQSYEHGVPYAVGVWNVLSGNLGPISAYGNPYPYPVRVSRVRILMGLYP